MGRYFRIALVASLGIHIFMMSAVIIVSPSRDIRLKPYTRIDFLGPILNKTAFDIMMENSDSALKTSYSQMAWETQPGYLKAVPPKRKTARNIFPDEGITGGLGPDAMDSLSDGKKIPDLMLKKSGPGRVGDTSRMFPPLPAWKGRLEGDTGPGGKAS